MDVEPRSLDISDDAFAELLKHFVKTRAEILYPYIEKMGNCKIAYLAGDHMIYEQKPQECGEIIRTFICGLENAPLTNERENAFRVESPTGT